MVSGAQQAAAAPAQAAVLEKPVQTAVETQYYLFKTPTCPNCKAAMAILDRAGIQYSTLNANENKELVAKFDIKQAPTLVIRHGDTFEKYRGVSDIKGWLMHK